MRRSIAITMLMVALALGLLVGCGASNPLVGKWTDKRDVLTLKNDGTFSDTYYWNAGSYFVKGNKLTIAPSMLPKETYTYQVKNGQLIMKNSVTEYDFKKAN